MTIYFIWATFDSGLALFNTKYTSQIFNIHMFMYAEKAYLILCLYALNSHLPEGSVRIYKVWTILHVRLVISLDLWLFLFLSLFLAGIDMQRLPPFILLPSLRLVPDVTRDESTKSVILIHTQANWRHNVVIMHVVCFSQYCCYQLEAQEGCVFILMVHKGTRTLALLMPVWWKWWKKFE